METKKMRVRMTFTEELLGTASGNPEIHGDFIASKAPDAESREEEIAAINIEEVAKNAITEYAEKILGTASSNPKIHDDFIASKAPDAESHKEKIAAIGVEEAIKKSMTVFPRTEDGKPFIWDYQIRGYFKESCGFLRSVKGSLSSKLKAYKKKIDGLVFVNPRKIEIQNYGEIGSCQRPLRGQTAQGERIALANSETIQAGAFCEFEVECLCEDDLDMVREWLDYGKYHGMLQWRNSGKGTFIWKEIK